ncbi:MAG: diaminopimelate epimerase [Candidatus Altiarchaeota archaeon]|nr:diaminopimelate epimerase [Candidatus Altiarchaeota archaeon]
MQVNFTKLQGSGNDFILVDEWDKVLIAEADKAAFVKEICQRHFGVGSDGLIFVAKSDVADVNFIFYNPDGSRAEMCGNGIRCLAKYVYEQGIVAKKEMRVETLAGIKSLNLVFKGDSVSEVKVGMGRPQVKRGVAQVTGDPDKTFISQKVMIHGFEYTITSVGMGNPHAVLFYENIDGLDVKNIGARIRNHLHVFPNGVNVHFVELVGINEFKIRTYERGVEDETLACGTGICASAVASVLTAKATPSKPIVFNARGGRVKVELDGTTENISEAYLIGPAEYVFTGVYTPKL